MTCHSCRMTLHHLCGWSMVVLLNDSSENESPPLSKPSETDISTFEPRGLVRDVDSVGHVGTPGLKLLLPKLFPKQSAYAARLCVLKEHYCWLPYFVGRWICCLRSRNISPVLRKQLKATTIT